MNRFNAICKKTRLGFSLIELLIVVAIVGILSAIAYPSYTQYLIRSGRAEGVSMLLQMMERQENHYRDNLTYAADLSAIGFGSSDVESETGKYTVSASTCSTETIRRCVMLTAVGQGRQVGDGDLTLNSRGQRSENWPE